MPCRATHCTPGMQMAFRRSHRLGGALTQTLMRTWHGPLLPAWKRQVSPMICDLLALSMTDLLSHTYSMAAGVVSCCILSWAAA